MDGFTDRLSQHFASPQEMITANSQAEATEAEKLQSEVDRLTQTLKNIESRINAAGTAGAAEIDISGITEQLGGISDKLETHIHKENVRVYRNVQASLVDELGKQSELVNETINANLSENNRQMIEILQSVTQELQEKTEMLSAMMDTLNEQQKSQGSAVSGMATQLNNMEESMRKSIRNRALLPIQIIMLVIILGELAINVLLTLGYL